jgi:hypothetical protein
MKPGISREISTSGLHLSSQRVAAKWAAWVHAVFGSVRSSKPPPMVAISSSDVNGSNLRMILLPPELIRCSIKKTAGLGGLFGRDSD